MKSSPNRFGGHVYVLGMHTFKLKNHYQTNLNLMSIGEVNSDHSGSQSPVRNVNHLGLHKDREFKPKHYNLQNELEMQWNCTIVLHVYARILSTIKYTML